MSGEGEGVAGASSADAFGRCFLAVTRAACSDEPDAGTAVYRFVRYAIDEQKHGAAKATSRAVAASGLASGSTGGASTVSKSVFAAYERRERPTDVAPEERLQPRLGQRVALIPTDQDRALRVMSTLRRQCGRAAALAVTRAACSDEPDAGTMMSGTTDAFGFTRANHTSAPSPARCWKRTNWRICSHS